MIIRRFHKSLKSFIGKKIYLCYAKINPFLQLEVKEIENLSNLSTNPYEKLNSKFAGGKDRFNEESFKNSAQLNEKLFIKLIYNYQTINAMTFYKNGIKSFSVKYHRSYNKKTIDVGGNYKQLLDSSTIFSDKSLFIKEIIECSFKVILITMPRRWGKSTNLDMLRRFIGIQIDKEYQLVEKKEDGDNYQLFFSRHDDKDLEYSLDITHTNIRIQLKNELKTVTPKDLCCSKPVIYLNLKDCVVNSYDSIKYILKHLVIELYESQHEYLCKDSNPEIKTAYNIELEKLMKSTEDDAMKFAILNLIELLYKRFDQKVWVLIDEYDSAINHAMLKFKDEDIEKTISLFRNFYQSLFKDSPYVEKGVLTGIVPIAQSGILSGLNNLGKFDIDDPQFSKYYGLNQEEIQQFLDYFNIPQTKADEIKNWYNGYKIIANDTERVLEDKYNIWSIVNCLVDQQNRLKSYWMDRQVFELIRPLLKSPEMKDIMTKLTTGQDIYIKNLNTDFTETDFKQLRTMIEDKVSSINEEGYELFLSYFYYLGYLTNSNKIKHYRLPNYEIRVQLLVDLSYYFDRIFAMNIKQLNKILNSLYSLLLKESVKEIDQKLEQFSKDFETLIEDMNNNKQGLIIKNEDIFHSFINALAVYVGRFKIQGEIHTIKNNSEETGWAYILIAKYKIGMIIGVEYNNSAKKAMNQGKQHLQLIKDKQIQVVVGINITSERRVEMIHEYFK